MLLTGPEIENRVESGLIVIKPYDAKHVNPNSYNVHLGPELSKYTKVIMDPRKDNPIRTWTIPEEGTMLKPGKLYLARTIEYTESHDTAPMINGRSSLGRLGLKIHITAGFGDVGFCGHWTLEMECTTPIMVYPGMPIGQICFHELYGKIIPYKGRYSNKEGSSPVACRLHLDKQEDSPVAPLARESEI